MKNLFTFSLVAATGLILSGEASARCNLLTDKSVTYVTTRGAPVTGRQDYFQWHAGGGLKCTLISTSYQKDGQNCWVEYNPVSGCRDAEGKFKIKMRPFPKVFSRR